MFNEIVIMGAIFSSAAAENNSADPTALSKCWWDVREEISSSNGLKFAGVHIQDEAILELILSHIPVAEILNLTQVCRSWKDVTTRRSFWRLVFEKNNCPHLFHTIPDHVKNEPNSWLVFYAASKNLILSKNFIQNHSGENQMTNWTVLRSADGGWNRFTVESPPVGIDPLPPDPDFPISDNQNEDISESAFVSGYSWCSHQQKIDLWASGLTPAVMRMIVPFEFMCSQMIGARFDCGNVYRLHICLQDQFQVDVFDEFLLEGTKLAGSGWSGDGVRIVIDEDKREDLNNLRYLIFTQHGKDNQFWAGRYGAKFSRASVKLKLLLVNNTKDHAIKTEGGSDR